MSTTPKALGVFPRSKVQLLIPPLQVDSKVPLQENVTRHSTQVSAPTLTADYDTHKKDRVRQSKEPGKAKERASSMAKVRPEEKHLVHPPEKVFEACHLQGTLALHHAENGEQQDIVLNTRRPALATTTIHRNAEIGQLQAADVTWTNTVRLFMPPSTLSNNTL